MCVPESLRAPRAGNVDVVSREVAEMVSGVVRRRLGGWLSKYIHTY